MNRPIWTLTVKEISTQLNSPATYVIFVLFLILTGWFFAFPLFQSNQSSLETFMRPLPILFTFLLPALTMRSFSEEFRSGTIEYLTTLPLEDHQLVLAKYFSTMLMVGMLLFFTLSYPLILIGLGAPDAGEVVGTYLAIIGLAAFYASIGLWASALTRNQVVAFIIGFFVCFVFYMMGYLVTFMPPAIADFIRLFSLQDHFEALARGVIDTRDILYWISGTAFFLFACWTTLTTRRWR